MNYEELDKYLRTLDENPIEAVPEFGYKYFKDVGIEDQIRYLAKAICDIVKALRKE